MCYHYSDEYDVARKGRFVTKKFITVLVVAAMCACLCFSAAGSEGADSSAVYDISPFALENIATVVLNGFSETNEGWDCDGALFDVTVSETVSPFPGKPLTGDGALICRVAEAEKGREYFIAKSYEVPVDLSEYSALVVPFNCVDVGSGTFTLIAELYSEGKVYMARQNVRSEGWSGVFFDISDWEGKDKVEKMRLGIKADADTDEKISVEYCIDSIMLSDKPNAANRADFSADGYLFFGGNGVTADGCMDISVSGDELIVQSMGFAFSDVGDANCLRVDFDSEVSCDGVRVYTQSESGEYVEKGYAEVHGKGEASVCLPFGDCQGEIRLVFEGVDRGNLKIFSIRLDSACVEYDDIWGIYTCALNSNTEELIIRGSIGADLADRVGREILLFASEFCDDVSSDTLAESACIEKNVITTGDFIFRVKYDGADEGRALLFKKYSVAVKTDDGLIAVGVPHCITNPESVADVEGLSAPKEKSGKGIYGESISFMQEVGATDTVVRVDIGDFFVRESGGGSKFECDGNLFYYDSEYLSVIDTLIENYAEKNIDVTLVLVVSDTEDAVMDRVLIHNDADLGAEYCAYNTADRQGLSYLRAFCEFFAKKYCRELKVTRFVFGDSVANCSMYYNMGQKSLSVFVSEYADGLRVVYNAVRSYSPYVGVYTYIDSNWNRGLPYDLYVRYDNMSFLRSLDMAVSSMGDIDWGIAHDPYPRGVKDYFAYRDGDEYDGVFSDNAGFKNLKVIKNFLNKTEMLYNNSVRDHIIIENTLFAELSDEQMTADYVYNCYKAMNSSVSAYITNRGCNYNDAMKYVDTTLSFTASSFVSDYLGVANWESVIDGFSAENIELHKIQTGKIRTSAPNYIGKAGLSDFRSATDGWSRYGFTERMTAGYSMSGKEGLLSVYLGNVPEGEARGIFKEFAAPLDMSKAPILHFGLNIASLPTNVNYSDLTVIVTAGNDLIEYTGRIKEAVWTDIYCDLTAFRGVSKVDSIKILFYAGENYYDSPQVLITAMEHLSAEYDDQQLFEMYNEVDDDSIISSEIKPWVYISLGGVLVVATIILICRRTAKVKKKN